MQLWRGTGFAKSYLILFCRAYARAMKFVSLPRLIPKSGAEDGNKPFALTFQRTRIAASCSGRTEDLQGNKTHFLAGSQSTAIPRDF